MLIRVLRDDIPCETRPYKKVVVNSSKYSTKVLSNA